MKGINYTSIKLVSFNQILISSMLQSDSFRQKFQTNESMLLELINVMSIFETKCMKQRGVRLCLVALDADNDILKAILQNLLTSASSKYISLNKFSRTLDIEGRLCCEHESHRSCFYNRIFNTYSLILAIIFSMSSKSRYPSKNLKSKIVAYSYFVLVSCAQ